MPTILTADAWGRTLLPGKSLTRMRQPASYWIIHHTAGGTSRSLTDELRMVNADALDEGKTCIDYSFAVTKNGEIGEGRGWGIIGAHTGTTVKPGLPRAGESYNACGHALVFIGNYHTIDTPTRAQLDAAAWLIAEGVRLGHVTRDFQTIGHRTAGHANGATACPGDRLFAAIPALHQAALDHLEGDVLDMTPDELRILIRDELDTWAMDKERLPKALDDAAKRDRVHLAESFNVGGRKAALVEAARLGAAKAGAAEA